MKIHYYSGATLPSNAAKSVHVMKMCEALGQAGHDVTLFAKGASHEDVYGHYGVEQCFKIHHAPNVPIPYLSGVIRIASGFLHSLKIGAPDLIYGRDIIAVILAPSKAPRIFEAHQMPANLVHRILMRFQKHLVVISEGLRHDMQNRYKNLTAICVAHDGANIPSANVDPITLQASPQGLNVGYAGSLQRGKGAFFLIELAKNKPKIHIHILGGNAEEVKALSENKPANVTLYGHIPHAEVGQYLQACDVLVAPYLERATIRTGQDIARWISPMKLFEFMAAEKPIISSNLPVIQEILRDGENALLVEPENIEAWSNALDRLGENEPLRQKLAKQAHKDLFDRYTWTKRAAHIIEFCNQSA